MFFFCNHFYFSTNRWQWQRNFKNAGDKLTFISQRGQEFSVLRLLLRLFILGWGVSGKAWPWLMWCLLIPNFPLATIGKVLLCWLSWFSLYFFVWLFLLMAHLQVCRQFYSGDHHKCVCVCVYMSLVPPGTNVVLHYVCVCVCVCVCLCQLSVLR